MRSKLWGAGFVLAWSAGYIGAEVSAGVASPATMLAWRYLLTAAVLVLLISRVGQPVRRSDLLQQGAIGVLAHVVCLGGSYTAISLGMSASSAILVAALQPMVALVFGAWWWADQLRPITIVGLLVGVVAVAITVGGPGAGTWFGLAMAVASLLGLTGAALLERAWQPSLDLVTALAIQAVFAAGIFTAWALATGNLWPLPTDEKFPHVLIAVVLIGLACYAAFGACLRLLGPATTSTLLYLTPPVTALWGWLMFDHPVGPAEVTGLVLAGLAVALVLSSTKSVSSPVSGAPCGLPPAHGDGSPSSRC